MQVNLVRHGTTALVSRVLCGRAIDPALDAQGRSQAERAGSRLGTGGAIWSSPRLRTRQTADIIAAGQPVMVDAALDEIDFGAWSGRSFDELAPASDWQRWNAVRSTARPPGGESFADVAARMESWLAARAGGGTVTAVTHCDVIRALLCRILGLSADDWWRFDVDCGSITRIAVEGDRMRLLSLNEGDR